MTRTQERALIEFEALGKDLLDIVSRARESHAKVEAIRAKMEQARKEDPHRAAIAVQSNPSLFLPEIDYMIARLQAVKQYLVAAYQVEVS